MAAVASANVTTLVWGPSAPNKITLSPSGVPVSESSRVGFTFQLAQLGSATAFGLENAASFDLNFQSDGNLVLYRGGLPGATAIWQTHTYGVGATRFVLQNDGNMVIYRGNTALWQSETYGTRAPEYRLTLSARGVLTHSWLSNSGWIADWQV